MKRQSRAIKIIRSKTRQIIGGYENEVEDGYREELPGKDRLAIEIYDEVINTPGWEKIQNRDLRFITTKVLKQMIDGHVEIHFTEGK